MFTDIAGYSRMMEQNERLTLAVLEEHNRILFPLMDNYEGEVADAVGDGLLVVFDSVLSSYNCALNLQKAIASYNETAEVEERLLLRIGIHMGDIRYGDGRIYGNDVNIAARLLPLTLPGGICVSEGIYNQLVSKTSIDAVALGSASLKNIERPVTVYRLRTGSEEASSEENSGGEKGGFLGSCQRKGRG